MSLSASGRTWEEATSPAAVRLARRFEAAWREATQGREGGDGDGSGSGPCHGRGNGNGHSRGAGGPHPDLDDFLPDDAGAYPGARLALLRADLGLRWEHGERVGADWYRGRYPDLGDETLVALIYEEFCLREEYEEAPDPAEFFARFPEVASQLRRVLDIHGLVGSSPTASGSLRCAGAGEAPPVVFPEAGQTIAGFHLVEELGRGSFARVFLAQERQLADRLVALKVARTGSREPQTLARLQHTHIVPVHSTRTDPATGLHLLCMPFFGRLTLARVLADPQVRSSRSGADLVEVLDRLGPASASVAGPSGSAREALGRRSFATAIAWWGARMAEALEHAHDRGVLHRDIKPSNVLVTGDGMPMLLDFNLAREPLAALGEAKAAAEPMALGGTLDYMAPEHLEALGDGRVDKVDGRSDLFSLGVLLVEALTGVRPFTTPRHASSAADLLSRAAEERRGEPPSLRATHPEVPVALDVVVRRCLAPEPDDRYHNAGELAADLQAVADDRTLPYSREPWPGRAIRWVRRRRKPLAAVGLVAAALLVAGLAVYRAQVEHDQRRAAVKGLFDKGTISAENDDFAKAIVQFEEAETLAEGYRSLDDLRQEAHTQAFLAGLKGKIRDDADDLFRAAKPLRFRLIRFCGDLAAASAEFQKVIEPFFVLKNANWTRRNELTMLDPSRRERLVREVNELLFLWIVALDQASAQAPPELAAPMLKEARDGCDRALVFARPDGPWRALRARLEGAPRRVAVPGAGDSAAEVAAETSAQACFQWGMLRHLEGRRASALAWFRQAVRLQPGSYWYQYYLAYTLDESPSDADEALPYYDTAVALDEHAPWVRFCRARLYNNRSAWELALEDLRLALRDFNDLPPAERDIDFERRVRLEFGVIHRALGDIAAARADYAAVIKSDPTSKYALAARTNRARLDVEAGRLDRARDEYDAVIHLQPDEGTARLGRALLALQLGRAAEAEADLDAALDGRPEPDQVPDLLKNRAIARFLLGRTAEAEADATSAWEAAPSPGAARLRTRLLLEAGRLGELRLDDPDEVSQLPLSGPALTTRLRAVAGRLKAEAGRPTPAGFQALLTRAVILAALHDPDAPADADQAVAIAPLSSRAYLVRARVRFHRGELAAAADDVAHGLTLVPDEPRFWVLAARIKTAEGDPRGALADLDRADRLGADGAAHGWRAVALLALGDAERAARGWTLALGHDPENPTAYLGRARAFLRLGRWDLARADLEQAAAWNEDWSGLGPRILLEYARCLHARPGQLPRILALSRRILSAMSAASGHAPAKKSDLPPPGYLPELGRFLRRDER